MVNILKRAYLFLILYIKRIILSIKKPLCEGAQESVFTTIFTPQGCKNGVKKTAKVFIITLAACLVRKNTALFNSTSTVTF
jgi:hypothetical protein